MRRDARVHDYDEVTGGFRTLQIPYAVPEVCPVDPSVLKVRSSADDTVVFATSGWVWAETDLWPATHPSDDASGETGGPVAVRFRIPSTGEEHGVWCDDAIVSLDAHGRPCVLDALTHLPLCLVRAPAAVLGGRQTVAIDN